MDIHYRALVLSIQRQLNRHFEQQLSSSSAPAIGRALLAAGALLLLFPHGLMFWCSCSWEGIQCDITSSGAQWDLFLEFLGHVAPVMGAYCAVVSVSW
jgi:hypothetical protein